MVVIYSILRGDVNLFFSVVELASREHYAEGATVETDGEIDALER